MVTFNGHGLGQENLEFSPTYREESFQGPDSENPHPRKIPVPENSGDKNGQILKNKSPILGMKIPGMKITRF